MLIGVAFRNLLRNVRRTVTMGLTIALGTAALFCLDGFNHGVLEQYRESMIHSHYGHGQLHTKGYRETVGENSWDQWVSDWGSLRTFLLQDERVEHVFPRIGFSALLMSDTGTASGQGQGIVGEEEADFFEALHLEEGSMLYGKEEDGLLLGRGLADTLGVVPGDSVTVQARGADGQVRRLPLFVTGIFHTGTEQFDARIFRMPLDKAQLLLHTNSVETVSLGLRNYKDWGGVAARAVEEYPTLEGASFAELDKVYYQHSVDWLSAQFSVIQGIILVIVLLSMCNSSATAIFERKQEIGNLRANGEPRLSVLRMLACEGAILGLLGAVVGVVISFLFVTYIWGEGMVMPPGPGLTREFRANITLQPMMVGRMLLLSVSTAILATLWAGIRVVRISITDALRAW